MNERKFDEKKILLYKELGDPQLFDEIIKDQELKKYINSVCQQKIRSFPSTLMDFEDFVSLAYLSLWQNIQKYLFICPVCGIKSKTETMYKLHTINKHGSYIDPEPSISRYIKFNMGSYLQNELRREYSKERQSNVMTISLFSPCNNEDDDVNYGNQYDAISKSNIENDVEFKNCIELLLEKFDPFTKEIFTYLYKGNLKQVDIATIFHKEGRYSTEQSAAVVITRTIKNKICPIIEEFFGKINL